MRKKSQIAMIRSNLKNHDIFSKNSERITASCLPAPLSLTGQLVL